MKATKAELRQEIEALRRTGLRLANCAYNLSKDDALDVRTRGLLDELRCEWDAIARAESRAALARAKGEK